jgi:16S rRNA (adenine1518-N6/adenine1519-N6)-dimethyltransferase
MTFPMDDRPKLPALRGQVQALGLMAKKSMGQNFLFSEEMTDRIVSVAAPVTSGTILEVGPGPGGLTRSLLKAGASVVAIERDQRFAPLYDQLHEVYPSKLTLIDGDALCIKAQDVISNGPIKIVANLPYNIGTELLIAWLKDLTRIESLTLMFQKEVALRIVAEPNSKAYGRLSIICQWLCACRRAMDVPPGAFVPAPKVTSSVVHLIPKSLGPEESSLFPHMENLTRLAFGQRRKMIRSSLSPLFGPQDWENLGISSDLRAEALSVADFLKMARHLTE